MYKYLFVDSGAKLRISERKAKFNDDDDDDANRKNYRLNYLTTSKC